MMMKTQNKKQQRWCTFYKHIIEGKTNSVISQHWKQIRMQMQMQKQNQSRKRRTETSTELKWEVVKESKYKFNWIRFYYSAYSPKIHKFGFPHFHHNWYSVCRSPSSSFCSSAIFIFSSFLAFFLPFPFPSLLSLYRSYPVPSAFTSKNSPPPTASTPLSARCLCSLWGMGSMKRYMRPYSCIPGLKR